MTSDVASQWNKQLFHYYDSLESRIGYRLFLGGTRHFGLYDSEKSWPLPIDTALRRMEEVVLRALDLPPKSKILDAGCGVGHVAMYIAREGDHTVEGIDFMARHAEKGRRNVARAGMSDQVTIRQQDFHHLEDIPDNSFDGIYTMETLVHSAIPHSVLESYFRILKPGGTIVLMEYDHQDPDNAPPDLRASFKEIWTISSLDGWKLFYPGVLEDMCRRSGFEHVKSIDYSKNIWPMLWWFYVFAYIPYIIVKLLGLEYYFVNTLAGVSSWRGRKYWGYWQYKFRKPAANDQRSLDEGRGTATSSGVKPRAGT